MNVYSRVLRLRLIVLPLHFQQWSLKQCYGSDVYVCIAVVLIEPAHSITYQIFKDEVDFIVSSSEIPDDYPTKLFLHVQSVGTHPLPQETWKLKVLGLDKDLSFNLTVSALLSMFTKFLAVWCTIIYAPHPPSFPFLLPL